MRKGAVTATHALVMKFSTQPRLLELPIRSREILHVTGRGNRGLGWKAGCGQLLWLADVHTSPGAGGWGEEISCVANDTYVFPTHLHTETQFFLPRMCHTGVVVQQAYTHPRDEAH